MSDQQFRPAHSAFDESPEVTNHTKTLLDGLLEVAADGHYLTY